MTLGTSFRLGGSIVEVEILEETVTSDGFTCVRLRAWLSVEYKKETTAIQRLYALLLVETRVAFVACGIEPSPLLNWCPEGGSICDRQTHASSERTRLPCPLPETDHLSEPGTCRAPLRPAMTQAGTSISPPDSRGGLPDQRTCPLLAQEARNLPC